MTSTPAKEQKQLSAPVRATQLPFLRSLDDIARRALDISVSLLVMIILSPLFVLIALMIKRDSPGPIFYRGLRSGKGGKVIKILKFRTMYETTESYHGPKITVSGDPRITPIGRWLRALKLNELPQFWQVFRGSMSLVGPRPEDPEIVAQWPEDLRQDLLSVRPGITSPASIVYHDEENLLQMDNVMDEYLREILPDKLRLDHLYVQNRTLLTDLDVIFWTIVVVIPYLNRKSIRKHLLYWGPFSLFFSRHLTWFLLDVPIALFAVTIAGIIWRITGPLHIGLGVSMGLGILVALLFSFVNALLGLNRIEWRRARASDVLSLAFSCIIATLLSILLIQIPPLNLPIALLGLLPLTGFLAFLGFSLARYRARLVTGLASRWLNIRHGVSAIGERVIVVGAGDTGQAATWLLRQGELSRAFSIVGFVDDDPRKQGLRVEGRSILGTTADLPALIDQENVGVILLALPNNHPADQDRILAIIKGTRAKSYVLPDLLAALRERSLDSPSAENFIIPRSKHVSSSKLSTSTSVGDMREWLKELENLINAKDWSALRARIKELRASLDHEVAQPDRHHDRAEHDPTEIESPLPMDPS